MSVFNSLLVGAREGQLIDLVHIKSEPADADCGTVTITIGDKKAVLGLRSAFLLRNSLTQALRHHGTHVEAKFRRCEKGEDDWPIAEEGVF